MSRRHVHGTVSLEELGALLQAVDKGTWDDASVAALFKQIDTDRGAPDMVAFRIAREFHQGV